MNYFSPYSFKLLPIVVKNILIINFLLFLGTNVLYNQFEIDLTKYLGLYYYKSINFSLFQIITHMFMHGNFLHLFSNMFAFWMFGTVLENYMGSKKFLKFFFFSGLGAVIIHMFILWLKFSKIEKDINDFNNSPSPEKFASIVSKHIPYMFPQVIPFINSWNNSFSFEKDYYIKEATKVLNEFYERNINIPTVGASGAVFGILAAFGFLFPNSYIYLYFFIPIKAKYFVILYGLFELYSGVINQPGDNIAHFAHLGGMFFGYIFIKFFLRRKKYVFYDF